MAKKVTQKDGQKAVQKDGQKMTPKMTKKWGKKVRVTDQIGSRRDDLETRPLL
jgi:hypothetical protein